MKFEVLRQHYGDRQYWQGDERDMSEADAKTLVANGVLRKARPAPRNKAMKAPENKAE